MKRVLVLTALLLSLFCVGVAAWAEEGPYRYRLDGAGGAHLVQYLGAESSLVLPEQLGGYPLVGMDRDAFVGAENLRELTLPISLQEIQGNPMTAGDFVIRVPQGHSVFTIYNEALYNKALTHLYGHPRTSSQTAYIAPPTLISIGDGALYRCSNIREVWLSGGVRSIGSQAFAACENLLYVSLNDGDVPMEIALDAFATNRKISFGYDGEGTYGHEAVAYNAVLGSTPASSQPVPQSNYEARQWQGETYWIGYHQSGDFIYRDFGAEAVIVGYRGNALDITVPASLDGKPVVMLEDRWLGGHHDVRSVRLPDTLLVAGDSAFAYYGKLQEVSFSGSMNILHKNLFGSAVSLSRLQLPAGVRVIDERCFASCKALPALTLPQSLEYLHPDAFAHSNQPALQAPEGSIARRWQSVLEGTAQGVWTEDTDAGAEPLRERIAGHLATAVRGKADDSHIEAITRYVEDAEPIVRGLYEQCLDMYRVGQLDYRRGGLYTLSGDDINENKTIDPDEPPANSINLDLSDDAADKLLPYRTFFHESGHAVDANVGIRRAYQLGQDLNYFSSTFITDTPGYDRVTLEEAARFDVSAKLLATAHSFAEDEAQAQRVFNMLWDRYGVAKAAKISDHAVLYQVKIYYAAAFQKFGGVISDIYGGVTNNRIHLKDLENMASIPANVVNLLSELPLKDKPTIWFDISRHSGDYWYYSKDDPEKPHIRKYSSTGALPNELFAHYFSARIRGSEEELNLFRYFLPEATHVMEAMLPAMLEEAKAILLVSEAE